MSRCCPGEGTMAHVRGCVNHPEYKKVLGKNQHPDVLTGQYPVPSWDKTTEPEDEPDDDSTDPGLHESQ